MASPLSSDPAPPGDSVPLLVFHDARGLPVAVPREWEPGTLVLADVPLERWADVQVTLNGRPLAVRVERVAGVPRVTVPWDRAGAGRWRVAVRDGASLAEAVIHIRSAKLSDAALAAMVEDLETRLPASVAIGLDRLGAFAGLSFRPPGPATLAQEFEEIRQALEGAAGRPGLIETLNRLGRDPHVVLADREIWTPAERVRRPVPGRLAAALGRAGNLTAERLPLRLVDARSEPTHDTYENRLVREFRDQVDGRLRRLETCAGLSAGFAAAAGDILRGLRARFRAACWASAFLDGVGRLRSAPDRLTMVLLRRPAYRAALEGFLALRRSARVCLRDPALEAPMENVPALYETWGTLTLIDVLLAVAADLGFTVASQRLVTPGLMGPLVDVLPDGRAAVVLRRADGCTVTLTPQRDFAPPPFADLGSVSFRQIPDVTVEVRTPLRRELLILDPKYKLFGDANGDGGAAGPKKEDIDKMHAYRDAIRDANGDAVVRMAAILYPGPERWFGDGVAALTAMPGTDALRTMAARLFRAALKPAVPFASTPVATGQAM